MGLEAGWFCNREVAGLFGRGVEERSHASERPFMKIRTQAVTTCDCIHTQLSMDSQSADRGVFTMKSMPSSTNGFSIQRP
jgi:hypothetical protein